MTQIFTQPAAEAVPVTCFHNGCDEQVSPNQAIWYNVGISHYNKEKGVSYIQVHSSPFCCSQDHAAAHAHQRADDLAQLPHGEFDAAKLNPLQEHPDVLVQQNALYTPLSRAWASLPKIDALTGQELGDDIYVPHLDRWSNQPDVPGVQGGYHQVTGELGTATLESAIQLCHVLIDEILSLNINKGV